MQCHKLTSSSVHRTTTHKKDGPGLDQQSSFPEIKYESVLVKEETSEFDNVFPKNEDEGFERECW
jgi:hypothetical protein